MQVTKMKLNDKERLKRLNLDILQANSNDIHSFGSLRQA